MTLDCCDEAVLLGALHERRVTGLVNSNVAMKLLADGGRLVGT